MLRVSGFSVYHDMLRCVQDVSFGIAQNQIAAFLGPNGAGKTTLVSGLIGILRTEGEVMLGEVNVARFPTSRVVQAGMALVPQGRELFSQLTVRENLLLGGYLRPPRVVREQENRVLAMFVELTDKLHLPCGVLSGGEQQMVAIGRALMSCPKLLILDEPSTGLSPKMRKRVKQILKQLRDQGLTIMLIEQYVDIALEIADVIYSLDRGRIVDQGLASTFTHERLTRSYLT